MPGWVSPSCGPMTWTMPWLGEPMPWSGMPNSAQFFSSWPIWAAAWRSSIGRLRGVVGIEWSAVATVWPGRRTVRPRSRRPVNAWGDVTSWTRWRSIARTAGAPGSWVTTWSVQILSTMVRGLGAGMVRRLPGGAFFGVVRLAQPPAEARRYPWRVTSEAVRPTPAGTTVPVRGPPTGTYNSGGPKTAPEGPPSPTPPWTRNRATPPRRSSTGRPTCASSACACSWPWSRCS